MCFEIEDVEYHGLKGLTQKVKDFLCNLYIEIRGWYRSIATGINNFYKFRKVIWNYRWWDSYYLLEIIGQVLEDWTEHYGVVSHHEGDECLKARIMVMRKWLNCIMEEKDCKTGEIEVYLDERMRKEYQLFFYHFPRLLPRIWD